MVLHMHSDMVFHKAGRQSCPSRRIRIYLQLDGQNLIGMGRQAKLVVETVKAHQSTLHYMPLVQLYLDGIGFGRHIPLNGDKVLPKIKMGGLPLQCKIQIF